MGFVVAIMNSVAEATIDFMSQDPTHARKHSKEGFEAVWRVVA
jgi:diacylglycerol kinase